MLCFRGRHSIACGLLAGAIWLGLTLALVLWVTERGVAASGSVLLATILNAVGLIALSTAIRRKCRTLGFAATYFFRLAGTHALKLGFDYESNSVRKGCDGKQ